MQPSKSRAFIMFFAKPVTRIECLHWKQNGHSDGRGIIARYNMPSRWTTKIARGFFIDLKMKKKEKTKEKEGGAELGLNLITC